MTNLEREYFSTFTLERLKALRKAVAKEANHGGTRDPITEMPIPDGGSYVTRAWMRPGGKIVWVTLNKRKIDAAIRERENKEAK